MGKPYENSALDTSDIEPPLDVQQRLASQANSAEEYQQLIEQWKQQQAALRSISGAIPPSLANSGIQIDDFHWVDPSTRDVYLLGKNAKGEPTFSKMSEADSKQYLGSKGITIPGGDSTWHGFAPQEWQDPRYWQLQYDKLQQEYVNSGLDAESARRQALSTLISNRNSNAVNLADTSGKIAAQAAQFAANPRDAVSELMFRNAVGGATPFGAAQSNPAFPQYQTGLQNKFQELFGGVGGDLSRARDYLSAPPPSEFLSPSYNGPGSENINRNTTLPPQMSKGGSVNAIPAPMLADGYHPASSEGGTNLTIHEPAVIMGMKSKHVYATMSEHNPEQLIVKPLPSVQKAQKQAEKDGQDFMKSTQGAKRMDQGGSVTSIPDSSVFINELRRQLSGIGGSGGSTSGFSTPLPDIRLLAGAPANYLANDPDLADYALAGYSSMGISPRNFQSTLEKFTPKAPVGNLPRVSFA